ncbi:response regulator [Lentisphaera profundi]|uniref:Response regulator n=1 Tax=Lentisphaera profundi TaxID=1658616 RepID=A0ABY7VV79_9BACT|nr:response regulator [Lentisphaera profundi]WDE97120.1 response regulator [Lentisphaera profundi]
MASKRILVVDDEIDIRELLNFTLSKEGYDVLSTGKGTEAISMVETHAPSLVILDGMLPGMDGNDICYKLKNNKATSHIPVIMLSARTDETDQIIGLRLGADDYIPKPFSPKILIAKIDAILRRTEFTRNEDNEEEIIRHEGLVLNKGDFSATLNEKTLQLTAVEYKLLYFLCKKPGRVYTRERILEEIRGDDVIITGRTVDVHILSLRRKLGDFADLIETVRGVGYKIVS